MGTPNLRKPVRPLVTISGGSTPVLMEDVELLREIRDFLRILTEPRAFETRVVHVPVPDMGRTRQEGTEDLDEYRRLLAAECWELEAVTPVQTTPVIIASKCPTGKYVTMYLRRPQFQQVKVLSLRSLLLDSGRPDAGGDAANAVVVNETAAPRPISRADAPGEGSEASDQREELANCPTASGEVAACQEPTDYMPISKAATLSGVPRPALVRGKDRGEILFLTVPGGSGLHGYTHVVRLSDVQRWKTEVYSKLPPPTRGRPKKRQ